jgi:hypothetical protein
MSRVRVPAVCMVVSLRSQAVLEDPPIAAGVSAALHLVWRLRPLNAVDDAPRAPQKRGGSAKRALQSGWNKNSTRCWRLLPSP